MSSDTDQMTREEALQLARKNRFELERCRKNLHFNEQLLVAFEEEWTVLNERHQSLLQQLKNCRNSKISSFDPIPSFQHCEQHSDALPADRYLKTCQNCKSLENEKAQLLETIHSLEMENRQKRKMLKDASVVLERHNEHLVQLSIELFQEEERARELENSLRHLESQQMSSRRDSIGLSDTSFGQTESESSNEEQYSDDELESIGDELGIPRNQMNFGAITNETIDMNFYSLDSELSDTESTEGAAVGQQGSQRSGLIWRVLRFGLQIVLWCMFLLLGRK